jgi:hypothetical protein
LHDDLKIDVTFNPSQFSPELPLTLGFFQYGISGPYWYAGGATIQIIIFSILSITLKTRAPGAKTFLQVSTETLLKCKLSFF